MVAATAMAGCTEVPPANTKASALQVGDCLRVGGAPDRPEAHEVPCGTNESNFKVVATVAEGADGGECPADVDSFYSQRGGISDAVNTVCLDIDWVVGGCMSIDPDHELDPIRVNCSDTSAPHRQRATQILTDVAAVDQCTSGQGYAYPDRQFTVCVEDVG